MNVRCGLDAPHDEHGWTWRHDSIDEFVWRDGEDESHGRMPEDADFELGPEAHDDLDAPESEAERYDRETRETAERT
jgi:hypothetical protein